MQQELEAERDRSEVLAEAVRIRQVRVNTSADVPAEVQDLRNAYLNAIRAEREILRTGRAQAGGGELTLGAQHLHRFDPCRPVQHNDQQVSGQAQHR